jgi:type I restriction enzyme S subunit
MDWETVSLGELVSFEYGKPLKADQRDGSGYPVFGSAGEVGLHSDPLLDEGPNIVVGRKGTAGSVIWCDGPCSVIDTAYFVKSRKAIDFKFTYLTLCAADLPSLSAQTGVPGLNRERAYQKMLRIPPIAEQRRIVDVIDSVDNYITALETRAETARTARSALLHELLSNPGPDWVDTTLGDLLSLEYGKPLKEEDRDGHGFPVFGSAGQVGLHSIPLLRQGPNIVVGRKGTAGAVIWSEQPCSVIDTAYFVRPKIQDDLRFTYLVLASADLPALAAQTGVPGLNRERAYSVRLTKPPLIEQKRIVAIVGSIDLAVASIETSICNVRNLRTALLSDLLSGNHAIPASYNQFLGAA